MNANEGDTKILSLRLLRNEMSASRDQALALRVAASLPPLGCSRLPQAVVPRKPLERTAAGEDNTAPEPQFLVELLQPERQRGHTAPQDGGGAVPPDTRYSGRGSGGVDSGGGEGNKTLARKRRIYTTEYWKTVQTPQI